MMEWQYCPVVRAQKEKKHVVRALETVGVSIFMEDTLSIIQAITVIANVKENTVSKIGAVA